MIIYKVKNYKIFRYKNYQFINLFNLLFQSKVSEYFLLSLDFIKKEIENYTPSLVEYRKELLIKKIKEKKCC